MSALLGRMHGVGVLLLLFVGCLGPPCLAQTSERVVHAADEFLSTLSDAQRKKVLYAYDDAKQRARWSNFPTGIIPRGGMSLKEMSAAQRAAAMNLLATVLSPKGLEKVNQIRQADDDFKANGSKNGPRGIGRPLFASENLFGGDLYFISFLGKPSTATPWMLQFGGHHLALNITIAGNRGVLTPTLTGAQPAVFKVNGQTLRPLGRESDAAFALFQSLDEKQRRQAILNYRVADLVLGPGHDDKKIVPEGLKASAMDAEQRAMLLNLIGEWAGIINETSAAARMAEMTADLNETWFAWSGPVAVAAGGNITAYYRIQGPHLVIEYAPQSDEPGNHVHTIYRDPTNDYGRQFGSK
jgi:hypothetical protein